MNRRTRIFVSLTASTAAATSVVVLMLYPGLNGEYLTAAAALGSIALLSQLLAYAGGSGSYVGTISFVPFLALASIAPNSATVLTTTLVVALGQLFRPYAAIKRVFNVAQQVLAISVALLCYRAAGGTPLLSAEAPYLPLLVLFAVFMVINNAAVTSAISLSSGQRFADVWFSNMMQALVYDLFAWPIIVGLVWVYSRFGVVGVFGLSLPLLGLRQIYKMNIDLQTSNHELLELMVAAIEARDPYTSGHSRRVSQNARTIAQIIGLKRSQVRRVEIAALLHDVGKIHEIFATILQKPGRLTAEENAIMQTHPIKSEELVRRVSQLRDLVPAVRHHHENWDGTGYPDGLAGERIPLGARIIIFADTIDAMTSDRPYRKALDADAVRQELVKWRGRQFDPSICDALLSSPRYGELFRHSPHQSLPHTQEIPRLRLAEG